MMDSNTQVYCIFGNPVQHSKSPVIHNTWFQRYNINAVYLAFKIDDISKGILAIKTLNIKGASITIPFKKSVMKYLDWIDKEALDIGAVNTIVNKNGQLLGYNTDYKAAIEPLKLFGIKDKSVCIVGAGGAARAIAYGIHKEKGNLVIVNRNKERGKKLAQKYQGDFVPMDEMDKIKNIKTDIIINTTSIGMHPNIQDMAFPSRFLHPNGVVMDIVYNPLKTKLLSQAQNKGCSIVDGLSMFVHQGAAQFKLWTDITPDIELKAILNGDT